MIIKYSYLISFNLKYYYGPSPVCICHIVCPSTTKALRIKSGSRRTFYVRLSEAVFMCSSDVPHSSKVTRALVTAKTRKWSRSPATGNSGSSGRRCQGQGQRHPSQRRSGATTRRVQGHAGSSPACPGALVSRSAPDGIRPSRPHTPAWHPRACLSCLSGHGACQLPAVARLWLQLSARPTRQERERARNSSQKLAWMSFWSLLDLDLLPRGRRVT